MDTNFYLQVPGVRGDVNDGKYRGWLQLDTFRFSRNVQTYGGDRQLPDRIAFEKRSKSGVLRTISGFNSIPIAKLAAVRGSLTVFVAEMRAIEVLDYYYYPGEGMESLFWGFDKLQMTPDKPPRL